MQLDPRVKQAQRELRSIAGKPAKTPAGWRAQAAEVDEYLAAHLMLPAPANVARHDVEVDVPGQEAFRVRIYTPPGRRMRGALLSFYGGAFRQGSVDFPSVDSLNRTRANDADIVIVAPDYAQAPEHRYPEAVEQGHAALEWLHANARSLDVAPSRIAISGTSAGGNIAAAVTLMNRDRNEIPLLFQLLEVPVLDLTGEHFDRRVAWRLGLPPFLVAPHLRRIARAYLGDSRRAHEPYASPLLAHDLSGLPTAHIFTAEYDLMRGDGEAYAARLRDAMNEAHARRFSGQSHESSLFTALFPGAREWQAAVSAILESMNA